MLNKIYYTGYEGQGSVKIWSDEDGKEMGFLIWIGFFETILQGCFKLSFQKEGLIECYSHAAVFHRNIHQVITIRISVHNRVGEHQGHSVR